MGKNSNYNSALLEAMNSKIDAIFEILIPAREEVAIIKEDVTLLKEDVSVLKEDMAVVKTAVTKTSQNFADHARKQRWLKAKPA